MNEKIFTLGEAAKLLRVQPYQITYLLATGQIPEPLRVGGRRCFRMSDLYSIADKLEATKMLDALNGEGGTP